MNNFLSFLETHQLLPAIFGLLGVIVGAVITSWREIWFFRLKNQKEKEYLVIQLLSKLERFVRGCADVVADDGLFEGRGDDDGARRTQVDVPKIDFEDLKVDWKVLPIDFMYEILDLPYKTELANNLIRSAGENADYPDFETYFEIRQYEYATLGLDTNKLINKLRAEIKLEPRPEPKNGWNVVSYIASEKSKLEKARNDLLLKLHNSTNNSDI